VSLGVYYEVYWRGMTIGEGNAFYVCDFGSGTGGDIYWYMPDDYWELLDDTSMNNTKIDIVSNYIDLGIPNEKRISRVYLDIHSKYATVGRFTIEPDYFINLATHDNAESSEPTGSAPTLTFTHPGEQAWTYAYTQFDSTVEQWKHARIDVGTKGTAFRYNIQAGDMAGANPGMLRIRPPKVMVQVKEVI
jgi:hypothetical protein